MQKLKKVIFAKLGKKFPKTGGPLKKVRESPFLYSYKISISMDHSSSGLKRFIFVVVAVAITSN